MRPVYLACIDYNGAWGTYMENDIYSKQLQQKRLDDAGDFPKVVLVDTVSMCNLRCSMCFHQNMKRKKGIMPWDLYTKIIDEIAVENKDARVWLVFFGDPFVIKRTKPNIFEEIAYAKNKGLTDAVLNTNANLMDEEVSHRLIEAGLDAIYIGLDAFNAETYVKLRVGGDYQKVVANVLGLLRLKKELTSNKPGVYVQFVVMDENEKEVDDYKRFWSEQGAIVKIRPKVSWAGMIDAPKQILDNKDRWPCHWAMQTLSITDTGDVVLCPCDLDARFVAGNVRKSTLKEVWNGKLKELRTLHLTGQYEKLPEMCRICRDWQSARSDYYSLNPL